MAKKRKLDIEDIKGLLKNWRILLLFGAIIFSVLSLSLNGLSYGMDFAGGFELRLQLDEPATSEIMELERKIFVERLNSLGLRSVAVNPYGDRYILIRVANATEEEKEKIINIIEQPAQFEQRIDGQLAAAGDEIKVSLDPRSTIITQARGGGYEWRVDVEYTGEGPRRFSDAATGKRGKAVDMFIDRPEDAILLLTVDVHSSFSNQTSAGRGDDFISRYGDTIEYVIENRSLIPIISYKTSYNISGIPEDEEWEVSNVSSDTPGSDSKIELKNITDESSYKPDIPSPPIPSGAPSFDISITENNTSYTQFENATPTEADDGDDQYTGNDTRADNDSEDDYTENYTDIANDSETDYSENDTLEDDDYTENDTVIDSDSEDYIGNISNDTDDELMDDEHAVESWREKILAYKAIGYKKVIIGADEDEIPLFVQAELESMGFKVERKPRGSNSPAEWVKEITGIKGSPSLNFDPRGQPQHSASLTGGGDTYEQAEDEVKEMKILLTTGNLPIKVKIGSQTDMPPTLGMNYLNYSLIVWIIALIVVALIIFIRYRRSFIVVPIIFTGLSEILLILGVASVIKWQLDLAAIAGLIAAVGTGVDDQIIITDETLSRAKKTAKKVVISVTERIGRAFFIIFTAGATTIFAMTPLISIPDLKGFAFITIIGVLLGVFITRPAFAKVIEFFVKRE